MKEVKAEVGDNWFVVFEDEQTAVYALNWLHSQTYEGEPVRARMKTESSNLRSYYVAGQSRAPVAFVPQTFQPYNGAYQQPYGQYPYFGYEGYEEPAQPVRTYNSNNANAPAQRSNKNYRQR